MFNLNYPLIIDSLKKSLNINGDLVTIFELEDTEIEKTTCVTIFKMMRGRERRRKCSEEVL